MKIQEVCEQLHTTRKAIYYYEQQGLITIRKQENGYREFLDNDVERLKEIIFYRNLGLSIQEIHEVFDSKEPKKILQTIYEKQKQELHQSMEQLDLFHQWINGNQEVQDQVIELQQLSNAFLDHFQGYVGRMILQQYLPYLKDPIRTDQQKQAYENILKFLDTTTIKMPFIIRLAEKVFLKNMDIDAFAKQLQKQKEDWLEHKSYEEIKELCLKNYELQQKWYFRYNPMTRGKAKMYRQLKDVGYFDICFEAMKQLSPSYNAYYQKMEQLNQRLAEDIGLFYNSKGYLTKK